MKNIDLTLFNEESFVEEQITNFNVDLINKKICLCVNGGFLNNGVYLSECVIEITGWYDLKVFKITEEDTKRIETSEDNFINSILKFKNDTAKLILSDVGCNCWIEWVFLKPKVTMLGEYDNE